MKLLRATAAGGSVVVPCGNNRLRILSVSADLTPLAGDSVTCRIETVTGEELAMVCSNIIGANADRFWAVWGGQTNDVLSQFLIDPVTGVITYIDCRIITAGLPEMEFDVDTSVVVNGAAGTTAASIVVWYEQRPNKQ